MPWWKRVVELGVPALIVYGAEDSNVDVSASAARLREHLPGGGVALRIYPDTGHSLRIAATGALRPDVIADTCDWLHASRARPTR